jgi:hypothetical protein
MVIAVLTAPVIAQIRIRQRLEPPQKFEGTAKKQCVELRWE